MVEQLLQRLLSGTQSRQPIPAAVAGTSGLETLLQNLLSGNLAPVPLHRLGSIRQDWTSVVCFSCGKAGHSATRCPALDESFPFMLLGWKAEKEGGGYVMISPRVAAERHRVGNGDGQPPGSVVELVPRTWGRNSADHSPPGGSYDLAVGLIYVTHGRETFVVSAVLVEATPGRSARILPSVSDSVVVIAEGFQSEYGTSLARGLLQEAGGVLQEYVDLAVGGVAAVAPSPVVLAAGIPEGVMLPTIAVAVSLADFAEVVAAYAASLADAGILFPDDPAGMVTVGVAALVDAGPATMAVVGLADAG